MCRCCKFVKNGDALVAFLWNSRDIPVRTLWIGGKVHVGLTYTSLLLHKATFTWLEFLLLIRYET